MRNVELALRVLEHMTEHSSIGVSELARMVEAPKSTVQRSLETLSRSGWIESTGEDGRKWRIATKPILRIQRAAGRRGTMRAETLREMEQLRAATGETVVLSVRDGDEVVTIEQLESIHSARVVIAPGSHALLHLTCAGLALAAHWPEHELDRYVRERLADDPDATGVFECRIRLARSRGFASSNLQNASGLVAVSASIVDAWHQPIAAITISAPTNRMSLADIEKIGPALVEAVRRVAI